MRNNDFDSDENEEAPLKSVRTSRREHRSRRIDVMRELESGVVDERPIKERFSREFKKAKIKRIKNPVENIGEENCVEGLVIEVHRRTCEVRLDDRTPAQDDNFNDSQTLEGECRPHSEASPLPTSYRLLLLPCTVRRRPRRLGNSPRWATAFCSGS